MFFREFFLWVVVVLFDVNVIGGVGGFLLFLSSLFFLGFFGLVLMEVLLDLDGWFVVDVKVEIFSVLVLVDVLSFYWVKENYIEEMF